jgi:hypothetical protein
MDLEQELLNLKSLLGIPIDNIEDLGNRVRLFLGAREIGFVPYFIVNDVVRYETSDAVLNRISWNQIFIENQTEIEGLIQEHLDFEADDFNIVILNFRRLQVEDINNRGLFSFFNCDFNDGEWQVNIENNN